MATATATRKFTVTALGDGSEDAFKNVKEKSSNRGIQSASSFHKVVAPRGVSALEMAQLAIDLERTGELPEDVNPRVRPLVEELVANMKDGVIGCIRAGGDEARSIHERHLEDNGYYAYVFFGIAG